MSLPCLWSRDSTCFPLSILGFGGCVVPVPATQLCEMATDVTCTQGCGHAPVQLHVQDQELACCGVWSRWSLLIPALVDKMGRDLLYSSPARLIFLLPLRTISTPEVELSVLPQPWSPCHLVGEVRTTQCAARRHPVLWAESSCPQILL